MKTFLLCFDVWVFKEIQAFSISEMMGIAKSWKRNENEWYVREKNKYCGTLTV